MTVLKTLFGTQANMLEPILQQRYALDLGKNETITLQGNMTISGSVFYRCFVILAKLFGKTPLALGKDIPVTVYYRTNETPNEVIFDRVFHYPKAPFNLCSTMIILKDGYVIEMMSKRIGCRLKYDVKGKDVVLRHVGYCLKSGQRFYSLPITWLLGKPSVIEEGIDDHSFYLKMQVKHFMGTIVAYEGKFVISPTP